MILTVQICRIQQTFENSRTKFFSYTVEGPPLDIPKTVVAFKNGL